MNDRMGVKALGAAVLAACGLVLAAAPSCSASDPQAEPAAPGSAVTGQSFATPDAAVHALVGLAGTGDFDRADAILGPGSVDLLRSGDDVADRNDALRFKAMVAERLAFEDVGGDRKIAVVGADGWPFAIPLVREAAGWRFDVADGREELENRRVGRNELSTLATLHAIVDGQREYQAEGRDGNPRCYAQKLVSEPGRHDGLYWPAAPGGAESPLGPEVAAAAAEGYRKAGDEPRAFRGYYYRVLASQGAHAAGGAKNYLDARGLLRGGFAAIAWPARYGSSGMKTFLVSQRGVVFEKDLGEATELAAAAITSFDPDASWDPVAE